MPLRYVEHRPGPALAPYLECLWEVAGSRGRGQLAERVVPDGCPELITHLRDPFSRLVDGRWRAQPRGFLAGTLTRPWLLSPGRRVLTLGMRFRPGSPRAFFDLDMAAAADREVPLAALIGTRSARALLRALEAEATTAGRIATAREWLGARLEGRPVRPATATPAVSLILEARGARPMKDVAAALGWTARRLERAFHRDLGIRPKLFARIARLNAVLATLDEAERGPAVDAALDAGYFDQAHLLRDFRTLAGRRPSAGRDGDGELARHFTRPERLRLLFEGE